MVDWITWPVLAISVVGGIFCLVWGLIGKIPNDYTLAAGALTALGLLFQLPASIISPFVGNAPTGDLLEYWMYLVTAVLIIVAGTFWTLIERNRFSVIILGVACLSIAVMEWRMHVIWFIQTVS